MAKKKRELKEWSVPVRWETIGYVTVEACDMEEAMRKAADGEHIDEMECECVNFAIRGDPKEESN